MYKILQIAPAPPGWRAAFAEGDDHDPRYIMKAISCWVLIERNGATEVVGMSGWEKLELCTDVPEFLGYQEPAKQGDDTMRDWRVQAREYYMDLVASKKTEEPT